jgi:hypothetical protein
MPLERFSVADSHEIAEFLNRIWHAAYGPSGCPSFTPEYLAWLYGGPDAQQTIILGERRQEKIVALKAFLPRALVISGQAYRGSLNTHLAIDPALPLADRVAFAHASTLAPWQPENFGREIDVAFALTESETPRIGPAYRMLSAQGIQMTSGAFNQSIVALQPSETAARRATIEDAPAIVEFRRSVKCDVKAELSPAHLAHHWFDAPDGEVFVVEESGRISGAVALYRLETIKAGRSATIAVCEGLLMETAEVGCALLSAAAEYQRRIKAKGIVCENVTYLSPDLQRACRIIPSARKMRLSILSKNPLSIGTAWMVDVK